LLVVNPARGHLPTTHSASHVGVATKVFAFVEAEVRAARATRTTSIAPSGTTTVAASVIPAVSAAVATSVIPSVTATGATAVTASGARTSGVAGAVGNAILELTELDVVVVRAGDLAVTERLGYVGVTGKVGLLTVPAGRLGRAGYEKGREHSEGVLDHRVLLKIAVGCVSKT
jgi:hypothetical protein